MRLEPWRSWAQVPRVSPLPVPSVKPAPYVRPAWMRTRLFRFFSSVRLAVVLLSVLIVASAVGTVYESTFDAKVARYYIYEARWFNAWLLLLGANLACAAFSRMPWKRHHTGFLVTHLGIIILLVGAMIGRLTGVEGTMTLFKGQAPNNQLLVDQHVLRLEENGMALRPIPISIIGRKPTPERPWTMGQTPGGWRIELIDFAPILDADFAPQPAVAAGGRPALKMRLVSKRLKQTIESWLLVDDAEHNSLDLGLASVQLRRGSAPAVPAPSAPKPAPVGDTVDDSIVVFAQKSGEQVAQTAPGATPSGAKVRLEAERRRVFVEWQGATWDFDLDADRGKAQDLSASGLQVIIENYWPDFVMKDGQPSTASGEPRNPAALVRVRGHLPAPSPEDATVAAPPAGKGENQAIVYCEDSGALTFTLKTSASPAPVRGEMKVGEPINTGWADWQVEVSQFLPNAMAQTTFRPIRTETTEAGPGGAMANHTEGVKVRLSKGAESHEDWAAIGWTVSLPTGGKPTQLSYGFQIEQLPIGLQLTDFRVERDEGNDNPAGFKSDLKLTDIDGATGTGSCSMNTPFSYPGHWWNTFSGMTFKMSQASWNPENLNQSTVQILRDPGWLFKWIGSLLIVGGIFTLFYLRPAPKVRA